MKNLTPLILTAGLTLSSFSGERVNDNLIPAEITARGIVTALRQSSEERFVLLFPQLKELHSMMERNEAFYGLNLEAAKQDIAKKYAEELLPAVRRAYNGLVDEAEKRGIDWSDVTIDSVDIPEESNGFSSITITFNENGKKFSLLIERSLFIDGKWKVSQYVNFV